jgi:hypothetical protein
MGDLVFAVDDPRSGDVRAPLCSSRGFEVCEPFAGYRPSPIGVCMTLQLGTTRRATLPPVSQR